MKNLNSTRIAQLVSIGSARRMTVGASICLLAACANFKGIESSAQPKLPEDYATAESLPSQHGEWPGQNWATDIGGAPLQALVDEALDTNPGLQLAAARVNAARAMAEGAGAAMRPTIRANFTDTYQRFTENGLIPPPFAGNYFSDSESALNFSYDFDFWGKHSAELRAAVSDSKAANAENYASRLILSTALARSWLQLARQCGQLDLVERQQAIRSKIDHLTQLRLAAGLDTQSDLQQASLQTAALALEREQWQERIELTRNQIAALMGKGPDRGRGLAGAALPSDDAAMLPDDLPLMLLARRPDIVAARWRVEAAQGAIEGSKALFYPNVNLAVFVGASSLGLDNLLKSGSRVAGFGPAINIPIFDGGRLRAQLRGKVAAYDGAIAHYNQTLTDALNDVADQMQSLRAAEIQIEQQRNATRAAAASLRLARQREQVGTAGMLPVLAAESVWVSQRKTELDTQARRADLRVALIKALGGGFDAAALALETNRRSSHSPVLISPSTPTPTPTLTKSAQ